MKNFWKNGFEIDFENKNINPWSSLLVLPIIVWLLYNYGNMSNPFLQNKEWLKRKTEVNLEGIVVKHGIDSSNRNTPFIKLKGQEFYHEDREIWKLIEVGDSLSSKKNSPILNIYKKDTIIKVDYREIYKARDSGMRAY
jgi:hypothetical protein